MSTVKHAIRNRWTNEVLFECEVPDGMASGLRTRHVLEQAVKARANLASANLTGAYLTGANLTGAYLTGANLAGANLTGAYLAGAYLTGAYLTGAYLTGAYLTGANLTGAYLTGANLAGAKWRDGVIINKAPVQVSGLLWFVTILDAHMQIGCELHSLADWASFDDRRIVEMGGRDALRFWRENKETLLSLARAAGRSFEAQTA